jgi:hypothetical protein
MAGLAYSAFRDTSTHTMLTWVGVHDSGPESQGFQCEQTALYAAGGVGSSDHKPVVGRCRLTPSPPQVDRAWFQAFSA